MHIILFILIAALFIEQLGQNFLYKKFDFLIDIIGNLHGTIYYIAGVFAIIFAILILYKSIKNKEFKPQKWDICFILLLLWGFFSVIFAEDKELAIIGSHRMDGYFSYLIYASVYIGVRSLKNEKIKLWLIRFFSLVATSLCMDFFFKESITSIFFNQNHFGYLLTLSSMLLCGLFIYEERIYIKIPYILMFCINAYTLINVNTFGCYLAVLLGLVFTPVLMLISKKGKSFVLQSFIVLVLFVVISIGADSGTNITRNNFNQLGSDIEKIATNAEDVNDAGSYRIRLWKHSFKYIKEKPIFGWGPENTYYSFYEDGMGYDRPHNEYIQCALFMGIPAAIFYIVGLVLIFIHCMKNRKQLPSYAIISGITVFAYCISAFFGNSMFYTTPYFFIMLGIVSNPSFVKK